MKKEERTEMIGVRLTPRDRRAIEQAAEREGMSISEYVRAATLAYMALALNQHGLKMLAQGLGNFVEDALKKFGKSPAGKRGLRAIE